MSRLVDEGDGGVGVRFSVLGRLGVFRDGTAVELGPFKQRSLLALLLIHRGEVVSTDHIIDELWGEDASPDRHNALWVHVSNLRSALEPDRRKRSEGSYLLTREPGYVLDIDAASVDATVFEGLLVEGRALLDRDPAAAALVFGEALSLWRGRPYEEFTYEAFAQAEIARLEELRIEAVEARIDADLQRGMARELVGELESLSRQYPHREHITGQLMLGLYRSGRQADALRAYGQLKSRLGQELGIEPSAELKRLEEQIVLDDPELGAGASVRLPGTGREPGLAIRGFELRQELGSGRFGKVYRAYQPSVGREVAIRVVPAELANDAEFIRRFEAEAQLVARVEDPHVVPLYDYWREPDGAYVVMRLLRGGNLQTALADGAFDPSRVPGMVEQIGGALAAAHRLGVHHDNLTATSVLFDDTGNAYLAGFGIGVHPNGRDPKGGAAADVAALASVVAQALTGHEGGLDVLVEDLDPRIADVLAGAADPYSPLSDAVLFTSAALEALGGKSGIPLPADATTPGNPYKGLRPFEQADAEDFYGRERLLERLLARLGRSGPVGRFVAVVGPSGSGKSSVVKAGLLPALRSDALPGSRDWYQIEIVPGRYPFEELETALLGVAIDPPASLLEQLSAPSGIRQAVRRVLPDDQSQLVLVVDQLEELYTQADAETRARFLDALVDAVSDRHSRIRVVVTLRADFYDRPLQHRAFGELLREGTEIVTPMTPEELERAITGPAARVGIAFDRAVVAEMVVETADRAGALPLLQYALTELFEHRSGPTITMASYQALGGVSGALGERAESIYASLGADARASTRNVFLRLVTLGEGSEDTRRRVLLAELATLEGAGRYAEPIVQTFSRHRLLSFDRDPVSRGPTVEISHEALLSEWGRLRRWVEDGRSDVRAQRRLAELAVEWRERAEDPDFVLTGSRLARYEGWLDAPPVELTVNEARFLEAGFAEEQRRAAIEREREHRDVQLRRRSWLVAGLAGIVVLVVALAAFAFAQRQQASNLAAEIAGQERARQLTAEAFLQVDEDPELATMLAIEAMRATAEWGTVLPASLDAVHASLQSRGLPYPDTDAPIALRPGPAGIVGVFALPPNQLAEFAQSTISRSFTDAECATFGSGGECTDPGSPLPAGLTVAGGDEAYLSYAATDASQPLAGTRVTITGSWTDVEEAGFEAALAAIEERTGITIDYSPLRVGDTPADTARRGETDIAIGPWLGDLPALAGEGRAQDVTRYLRRDVLTDRYGEYLMRFATIGPDGSWPADTGGVYGVWLKLGAKSVIWYPTPEFENAGYRPATTWDGLLTLSDQIVADDRTPWCLGASNGWPATDWIESIVLAAEGPEYYDRWAFHEVPFDDPPILAAVQQMGQLAFTPGYVAPGPAAIPQREFWESALQLGEDPPDCYLLPQASYTPAVTGFEAGGDIDLFRFPVLNDRYADALTGAGDLAVVVADRPEVRAVLEAFIDPQFGVEWSAIDNGFLPANRRFDLSMIDNDIERTLATLVLEAIETGGFRMDASDLMPPALGELYNGLLVDYFTEGPETARSMLSEVEAVWSAFEPGG